MDFKEEKEKLILRRYSEPQLVERSTSSSRQSNSTAQSLQESMRSQNKKLYTGRKASVLHSSTFPLLPTFNNKAKSNQPFIKSHENHEPLPFFRNLAFHNRGITPNQRGRQEARMYHLQSKYTINAMKIPTATKLQSNPLNKRVQAIDNKDIGNAKILPESDDLLPDFYFPYSGQQSSIRRLSAITEKSNFSTTSKTLIFDVEEENNNSKGILPSVERKSEKNSRKLQEHIQMTARQFNPLESKAALMTNWFKSLEAEG